MNDINNCTISVLMCALNEEDYIRDSLNSLVKQDIKSPFEIVVIDNDSSDDTMNIAKQFTQNVYKNKERGKVPSLKYGLPYTRGDIIAFADADTVYPANWLSSIELLFQQSDRYQFIFGSSDMGIDSDGLRTLSSYINSCFFIPSLYVGVTCSMGFNMAIRKTALEKIFTALDSVAFSGWAIGTLALRLYGRESIKYSRQLQVPKCMRRYNKKGYFKSCSAWLSEWVRLALGRNMKIKEHEYYS